eukprot:9389247-Pyramimonas_sp.AAC.1
MSSTAKASADVKGDCADVKGDCADVKGCCVDVKGYYAPSGSRRSSCPALRKHGPGSVSLFLIIILRILVFRTVDFKAPIPHGDGAVSE